MRKIAEKITDLVGNTPMLHLSKYEKSIGLKSQIIAKLEYFNPLGSVKDRAALFMIESAEKQGLIKEDTIIIEPTSGNTGIGIAYICAEKGYKLMLTMPESMSIERRKILSALGAEIVLTPASEGILGSVHKAEQLHREHRGSIMLNQFSNEDNLAAHEQTTGPEIWADTHGKVDIFVSSVGTGGTISGVGRYLKRMNSDVKVVAVEPAASPVLSGGKAAAHKIQGIGAGFVPQIYDRRVVDEVVKVTDEQAFSASRAVASHEGLLVGISSGAALAAASQLALRPENRGKVIVVLLPDTGERYLSTELYG